MKTNTEKTTRVAIYARVANADQLYLDRKVEMCSEYAEHTPNRTVVAKYTDLNKSGRTVTDRSGFQQMIHDAKNGLFDEILVYELHDFSRNLSDVLYRTKDLEKMGVTVFFISDNIRTDDPDGEFRLTLMAALEQDESRKQSERIKRGHEFSRAKGTVFGTGNVLGYDKVDGNYVINSDQADTVRMIFDLCIAGYGVGKICDALKENGRLTSTGKSAWQQTTVARILKNPVYYGKICYPRSNEMVDGTHEPIVSEETFVKANQMMRERRACK